MAKRPARKKQKTVGQKRVGRSSDIGGLAPSRDMKKNRARNIAVAIAILFVALLLVADGVAVLVAMGMAPTLVSLAVERSADRANRIQAIAAFNTAGVLPFGVEIWRAGGDMSSAARTLGSLDAWLVMFGAAGAGFIVLWAAPQLSAAVLQTIKAERLKRIDQRRRALIEEWGPAVGRPSSGK